MEIFHSFCFPVQIPKHTVFLNIKNEVSLSIKQEKNVPKGKEKIIKLKGKTNVFFLF